MPEETQNNEVVVNIFESSFHFEKIKYPITIPQHLLPESLTTNPDVLIFFQHLEKHNYDLATSIIKFEPELLELILEELPLSTATQLLLFFLNHRIKPLALKMWEHKTLALYFSGYTMISSDLNDQLKATPCDLLVYFKSALSSQCNNIINSMWSSPPVHTLIKELREEQQILDLTGKVLASDRHGVNSFIEDYINKIPSNEILSYHLTMKQGRALTPYTKRQIGMLNRALKKQEESNDFHWDPNSEQLVCSEANIIRNPNLFFDSSNKRAASQTDLAPQDKEKKMRTEEYTDEDFIRETFFESSVP